MATCYYSAGFHVGELDSLFPLGTLTLSTAGEDDIVLELNQIVGAAFDTSATQFFFHSHIHSTTFWIETGISPYVTLAFRHYSSISWGASVSLALTAERVAQGWPSGNVVMQFFEEDLSSNPFPQYRLSYAGAAFTYQFSELAGARMFGVNHTLTSSSNTSHVLGTPWCVVWPRLNGISAPSAEFSAHDYEQRGIATLVHSDAGLGYGNARLNVVHLRDWKQEFETADNVLIGAGLAASPFRWTHQHLRQHCRTEKPFIVANGNFGSGYTYEVFLLRDEGAVHDPERASVANNAQWHVPYRTVVAGRVNTFT